MESFPQIAIKLKDSNIEYILKPKNYFYTEWENNKSNKKGKICMAVRGGEEGRIIMGAFAMID